MLFHLCNKVFSHSDSPFYLFFNSCSTVIISVKSIISPSKGDHFFNCVLKVSNTFLSYSCIYMLLQLVQFSSVAQLCLTLWAPWIAAHQVSLSITNSWSLLKLMSIESVKTSNHLILCHPLLLPSIFPSIRVFSNESVLHIRWPKYWSFSFSISPSNEYSGLVSFRMHWFDLLEVQGTVKSLL